MNKKLIKYRGQTIAVKEVEELGGHLDNLHDFNDTLLRSSDGAYYLRRVRTLKMPPNVRDAFGDAVRALKVDTLSAPEHKERLRQLRAFRLRHVKPRETIKRIKLKTAMLWWVQQLASDPQFKSGICSAIRTSSIARR